MIAAKIGNGGVIWWWFGDVVGQEVNPQCLAHDKEGNTIVSDKVSNRLLKINGLSGHIMGIFQVEEGEKMVQSLVLHRTEFNFIARKSD